jgi:DNA-directed RNA polymerase subunit E'/Rpb7
MNNPFIDTILYTTVALHPSQLNNNIYSNLKQNLSNKLEKRCYKNYGYVSKIYEILERTNKNIIPEDNNACGIFNVKFSCRLCHPLENTQIICKVNLSNDVLVSLVRPPIHVIVSTDDDRINHSIFMKDPHEKKIKVKKTGETLEKGMFVKTTILSKKFTDKDKRIIILGSLDDIATDEEIEQFYNEEYSSDKQIIDYEEYTSGKKQEQIETIVKEEKKKDKKEPKKSKAISESDTSSLDLSSSEEVKLSGGKKRTKSKK